VEIFHQTLVHDVEAVKVTIASALTRRKPLKIHDQIVLEDGSDAVWFTFPGAWHDIGRFHRADGTLTGIYANIITPCRFLEGGLWETTDLFLDLWIPAESDLWRQETPREVYLLDEDELDEACRAGWVDAPTARRARKEAGRLMKAAGSGEWPPAIVREWTRERARARLSGES
jgi:predicted RNA-binding protein associated with RNAse of E/G family